jgi:hypothetical protein
MHAKLRPSVSFCFPQTARRRKSDKKFLIEKQRPENDYFFRFESWAQDVSKTKVLTVQTLLREGIYLQKNNFRLG